MAPLAANPSVLNRFILQPGEYLVISTDASTTCQYGQLPYPAANSDVPATIIAVPANSVITLGPRADVNRWLITGVNGMGATVTQNPAAPVPHSGNPADVQHLYGNGAPSASTGANHAQIGSLYTDTVAGKLYINSGNKGTPSWRLVTSA
jgi:hypothetical protein